MAANEVLVDVGGGVATITLNRVERRNALTWSMIRRLRELAEDLRGDDAVRVVVLTGAGDKAFCAGADLTGMADGSGHLGAARQPRRAGGAVTVPLGSRQTHDRPGAGVRARRGEWGWPGLRPRGCGPRRVFGTPEIDVGLWPFVITVPLVRSMPPKKALELMMTGRRVRRDRGRTHRIRHTRSSPSTSSTRPSTSSPEPGAKSPAVMRLGPRLVLRRARTSGPTTRFALLHAMLTVTTGTEDSAEGLAAFAEKRPPHLDG